MKKIFISFLMILGTVSYFYAEDIVKQEQTEQLKDTQEKDTTTQDTVIQNKEQQLSKTQEFS